MKRLLIIAFLLVLTTMASAATFYTNDSGHTAVPTSSSVTKNGAPWTQGNVAFGTASTIAGKYTTVTMSNVTSSGSYGIVANYAGTKETYQVDYTVVGSGDASQATVLQIKAKTDKLPNHW